MVIYNSDKGSSFCFSDSVGCFWIGVIIIPELCQFCFEMGWSSLVSVSAQVVCCFCSRCVLSAPLLAGVMW